MNVLPEPDARLTAFGNQLVATHLRLREELARMRDGAVPSRDLRTHCLAFCAALTRHHLGEDDGAFPVIAREHPALRPVLEELTRDHEQIAEALTRLADPDAGRRELDTVAALLETHLVYEEKKLVALLNALTPDPDSTDAANLARGTTL